MNAPNVTHLQFQVLGILIGGTKSGQSIRSELLRQGVKKSGPGFYQLMARLEDAGFVKGWYEQRQIGDQAVKERFYHLTGKGSQTWRRTKDFYLQQFKLVASGGLARG